MGTDPCVKTLGHDDKFHLHQSIQVRCGACLDPGSSLVITHFQCVQTSFAFLLLKHTSESQQALQAWAAAMRFPDFGSSFLSHFAWLAVVETCYFQAFPEKKLLNSGEISSLILPFFPHALHVKKKKKKTLVNEEGLKQGKGNMKNTHTHILFLF